MPPNPAARPGNGQALADTRKWLDALVYYATAGLQQADEILRHYYHGVELRRLY